MKRVSIAFLVACLAFGYVQAQSTQSQEIAMKSLKKGEEPKEVLDALKKDFPGGAVQGMSVIPLSLYGKEWSVSERNKIDDKSSISFYQVDGKGKSGNFSAVYDKNGKLMSYKEVIKEAELPASIRSTLGNQFAGWQVTGDREKVKYNHGNIKIAYRVNLKKDKEHKHVFFDETGKIMRTDKKMKI